MFNEILTAVSTVGFPAAMCLIMAWYIKEREEEHGKEMSELKTAINNNTIAVTTLAEKLDRGED